MKFDKLVRPTLLSLSAAAVLGSVAAFAQSANDGKIEEKSQPDIRGTVKIAKVDFVTPKDGDTVAPTFTAKFMVEGLKVAPAGPIVAGTGHFHLLIDTPALKEGEAIPMDAKHMHFGKGQTETPVALPPGDHTLILQFADGAHRAYNQMLTKTIKIHVK